MVYLDSVLVRDADDQQWQRGLFLGFVAGGAAGEGLYLVRVNGKDIRWNQCLLCERGLCE